MLKKKNLFLSHSGFLLIKLKLFKRKINRSLKKKSASLGNVYDFFERRILFWFEVTSKDEVIILMTGYEPENPC